MGKTNRRKKTSFARDRFVVEHWKMHGKSRGIANVSAGSERASRFDGSICRFTFFIRGVN
jgi:hypothetical protein